MENYSLSQSTHANESIHNMKTRKQKNIGRFQSASAIHTSKPPPTPEQIRQRAHEIFLARGGAAGRELDDWLQAERELQAGKNPFSTD